MKWVTGDIAKDENGYFVDYGEADAAARLELDTITTQIRLSGRLEESSQVLAAPARSVRRIRISSDVHVMFDGAAGGRVRSPEREPLERLLATLREWGWHERSPALP